MAALLIYLAALYGTLVLLTSRWLPTNGEEDLWFVSAVGFLAYSLFDTPFFVPPSQVVASGIPSILLLLSIDLRSVRLLRTPLECCRWISIAIAAATVLSACITILLRRERGARGPWAGTERIAHRIAIRLGDGSIMFTPPAVLSIVGFHQSRLDDILWLTLLWIVLVGLRPVEMCLEIFGDIGSRLAGSEPTRLGEVRRIDSPNIIRVALESGSTWQGSRLHTACLPDGRQAYLLPLFVQTQDEELVGTGLLHSLVKDGPVSLAPGGVYSDPDAPDLATALETLAGGPRCSLAGFVVEESQIGTIQFEIAANADLAAGRLVFCRQGDRRVYYQILDARTREESFAQNPRGTHIVLAGQLGYREEAGTFTHYDWLPDMNSPVFLESSEIDHPTTSVADTFELGRIPHFKAGVFARYKDLSEYHTAILGVTGTGKTELAFDVIRQALRENGKIFCVDFTGEYGPRLADLSPLSLGFTQARMTELRRLVQAIETGEYGATKEKKALEEWETKVRPEVADTVAKFLEDAAPGVGLFELPDIANTRATLRATELYVSAIFEWARQNRKKRSILVVLEEAHTVVPEVGFYNFDKGETQAVVGRISQIALQGRKYGVGLLLISQRTALVSKTLLSQCNTVIAFALHDKTSLDYLSSVFGEDHVRAIPRLRFRHAIAYGKGVLSDSPILIEFPEDDAKRVASDKLSAR